MSTAQVLEQIDKLPFEGQREVFKHLRGRFDEDDVEFTAQEIAVLAHPERCRPLDDVITESKLKA